MKQQRNAFRFIGETGVFTAVVLLPVVFFQACDKDDPKPVNEEEVITTVHVTLAPEGGSAVVNLVFNDPDGEHGSAPPTISVSGPLTASTTYAAVIELLNETESPAGNISEEVAEEANDHLFCFDATQNIVIHYEDEDANALPLGLITSWVTGSAGEAEVTITLRHQPGTKTGQCPGTGETDVEVTFPLSVQ